MRPPTIDERARALRRTIAERKLQLDRAIATLGRVGAEQFTISGYLGKDPWPWLVGACVVGLILGMGLRRRAN